MKYNLRKKITSTLGAVLLCSVLLVTAFPAAASAAQTGESDTSKVADSSEMAAAEEVKEEGMVPVYGGQVADGTYDIKVESSSSMFRIVSAELTVKDGLMTCRMTMGGTGYLYVFMGTGEEAARADASEYISFEEGPDGTHSFTVPVEGLDQAIDCAAFSKKKEQWYDRSLLFRLDSLPEGSVRYTEAPADGTYTMEVALTGGSGKASVSSPAEITCKDGVMTAKLVWSSPSYDYMKWNGNTYDPTDSSDEEHAVFEIPVTAFDCEIPVRADTTAMSQPHEIAYTLNFDSATLTKVSGGGVSNTALLIIGLLVLVALAGGIAVGRKLGAGKKK